MPKLIDRDVELRRAKLDSEIEHFLRFWGPTDPREKDRFAAHLNSIVRLTYSEAQEPLLKYLTDIVSVMPLQPYVVKP